MNLIFNGFFTIEALIKMMAFGKFYFKERWNIFDFIIVLGTWLVLFIGFVIKNNTDNQSTAIKMFRVARILRLLKMNKSLKKILQTFIISLPGF